MRPLTCKADKEGCIMEFAGFDLGEETKEVIADGKKKLVLCPLGVLAVFL